MTEDSEERDYNEPVGPFPFRFEEFLALGDDIFRFAQRVQELAPSLASQSHTEYERGGDGALSAENLARAALLHRGIEERRGAELARALRTIFGIRGESRVFSPQLDNGEAPYDPDMPGTTLAEMTAWLDGEAQWLESLPRQGGA